MINKESIRVSQAILSKIGQKCIVHFFVKYSTERRSNASQTNPFLINTFIISSNHSIIWGGRV